MAEPGIEPNKNSGTKAVPEPTPSICDYFAFARTLEVVNCYSLIINEESRLREVSHTAGKFQS